MEKSDVDTGRETLLGEPTETNITLKVPFVALQMVILQG
jgi:hypothetical protein